MSGAARTNAGGGLAVANVGRDRGSKRSREDCFTEPQGDALYQNLYNAKSRRARGVVEEGVELPDAVEVAVRKERRRISRDLHDHAGQYLVGLSLRLAALEQSLADPKRSVVFAEIRGLLDRFCQELRAISQGGHQGIPFGSDLTVALRNLAHQWQGETGTTVRFQHEVGGIKCTPDDATLEALYRIAQEALTNIAKHAASASQVSIKLTSSKDFIRLAIEDDGPGLDFDNRGQQPLRLGGLANMQERLAERGGQLIICCPPKGGTSITATVPTERHASG